MMTFLYPVMLGLGVLVAVPFIIHLFGERKYHPLAFSSLKFLREIEKESMQRLHLRQWLILLSRALWIAMLVLALAMPFVNSAGGRIDPGILVFDASFSTRNDPAFVNIENMFRDEYARWEFLSYNEQSHIDSLKNKLDESINNKDGKKTSILLLTDLQDNEQNRIVLDMLNALSDRTYILPKLKAKPNYAIEHLETVDHYDREMLGISTSCATNEKDKQATTIYINLNGKQTGQMRTDMKGNASYFFSKPDGKESLCTVKSLDDDYPSDNSRYLVVNNFNQIRLLCINDPKDGYYHLKALEAMDQIDLLEITPEELAAQDLDDFDLVWFSGLYPLTKNAIERVKKFSQEGVLLLSVSRVLPENDPWRVLIKSSVLPVKKEGFLAVTDSDGNELHDMRISTYYRASDHSENILWKISDGSPLLFEEAGNIFLLTSPFHFEWNEMGLSPYFTKELSRMFSEMLTRDSRSYTCGEAIKLPSSFSVITTPTGEKHRVKNTFDKTATPGFYSIENEGIIRTVAVNIPEDECIQDVIIDNNMRTIDWDGENIDDIHRQIEGRNIQTLFFILAGLFIIFEMLLLRKGERTI